MDAVMEAVAEDFKQWLRTAKNQSTSDETYSKEDHRVNVKDFLFEFFSISHSFNISLDEIVTAFSSPDPSGYDINEVLVLCLFNRILKRFQLIFVQVTYNEHHHRYFSVLL